MQNGRVGISWGPFTETTVKLEKITRTNYFRLWTLIKQFTQPGECWLRERLLLFGQRAPKICGCLFWSVWGIPEGWRLPRFKETTSLCFWSQTFKNLSGYWVTGWPPDSIKQKLKWQNSTRNIYIHISQNSIVKLTHRLFQLSTSKNQQSWGVGKFEF